MNDAGSGPFRPASATRASERLARVFSEIDAANAADPNRVPSPDGRAAAELVYGRRMSERLAAFAPEASEHLQIAARGQHIERFKTPRSAYPQGRTGYLTWRRDLKNFHAQRVGEIMRACGYPEEDVARVERLVRKERLKADSEAQALEDIACLVFLEHYFGEFAPKIDDDKLADILAKTWEKMSPAGHAAALAMGPPARIVDLLEAGQARRQKR